MFKPYCDTHVHSHFSTLDGVSSPTENVKRAVELGMPGVAISDHGTVAGVFELYSAAKKAGITPLIGNELYFKNTLLDENKDRKYFHGVFLAQNEVGFKNLMELSSIGFREDHYEFRRPVVSIQEIADHSEGLVFSTGCMIGILGTAQKSQLSLDEADVLVARFKEIFQDRMFIEVGPSQVCMEWEKVDVENKKYDFVQRPSKDVEIGENKIWTNCLQTEQNYRAYHFSKKYGIKLIVASDAHMANPDLKSVQDMLMTGAPGNSAGFHFHQTHAMLSSEATWVELQKHHPYILQKEYEGMIDNTYQVLDFCRSLKLNFAPMVPKFPLDKHPLHKSGMTPKDLMFEIVKANGRMRWDDERYVVRLKEEVRTICNNGITDFTEYFIILSDIARAAKDRGVMVGPGRGSAGGCLLSYLMNITEIDPIKWGLNFTRFLNQGRLGTPKISFKEYSYEDFEAGL